MVRRRATLTHIWQVHQKAINRSGSLCGILRWSEIFKHRSQILPTDTVIGNIIGPQTFKSSEAPRYSSAYIAYVSTSAPSSSQHSTNSDISMLIGYCIKLAMVILLYVYMWKSNKKRDRQAEADGTAGLVEEKEAIEKGMRDETELDNKHFRYSL